MVRTSLPTKIRNANILRLPVLHYRIIEILTLCLLIYYNAIM
jgi:hypothetical protein